MSVKDAVANRFLELCKQRNIKINELANLSGVTASTAYSMLDEKRREVMPIANKWSIKEIVDACRDYFDKTGRRIYFEYC